MSYQQSNKRELEKFYTPDNLIKIMFELKDKYADFEISEYLENSAGSWNIIKHFDKPYIAFDIKPEPDSEEYNIEECNYLKHHIDYKKGRVAMINPPFNRGLSFLYKALKECDYVVAMLSPNIIFSLDYERLHIDEIQIWKKIKFDIKYIDICIIACRNIER